MSLGYISILHWAKKCHHAPQTQISGCSTGKALSTVDKETPILDAKNDSLYNLNETNPKYATYYSCY